MGDRSAQKALAAVGAAAAGYVAYRALKTAAWWSYVRFGPVLATKFKGDYAVVTGGSEGVGLGISEALAARGVNLVLVSRSEAKLKAAAEYLRGGAEGVAVVTVAADLTKDGAASKIAAALASAGVADKVSLLVCNAGGGVKRAVPYQEFTADEDELVRKLNGDATYALVKELLPGMVARGRGFVLCISSLITKMPFACLSNYYLEKAKINALATVLACEQDAFGTGVGCEQDAFGTGVGVQAHTLGAVVTPALAAALAPAAAAAAGSAAPALGACGEWVVRAMGKGAAPVITPYPFHALPEEALVDAVAALRRPGCLRRAVAARMSASFTRGWEK
ncbi:MAG: hypothetical protein J3K34DRAFT_522942 [Monoraphidium minutum]|nr:MAG: hypothetical protein J3K34DRAFT_522942 [Monoraphidium minutum]